MLSFNHILSILLPLLLLLLVTVSPSSAKRCHPDDEKALLKIKSHFNNAAFFSSWTPQTACCRKWKQVSCTRLNNTKIFRVNFLEISGEDGINGVIPSAVGDLPYLETLIFRLLPNLTGTIPPAIGKLTRLQFLLLNWNNLTGPIPPFFIHLTNLSTLSLNNNSLTGHIPPFLGHLPQLSGIDLSGNKLTGPIPNTFGLLPNNTQIQVFDNNLSGPIPRSMGKVNFGALDLSGNQLTGDASFLFGKDKTELVHLILSRNKLSFNLSKTVFPTGQLDSQLLVFDLSHNMIYGGLPHWLGQSQFIYQFDVSYNHLCGPIPTVGGKLQQFDASSFGHNKCLCGAPLAPCK